MKDEAIQRLWRLFFFILHPSSFRNMATLLLIDDDPDLLRNRVSHVLPAPAHRVEIAQTGAEGLERVAAACPDVILLDLRLPDQSGLDILRQLRRIESRSSWSGTSGSGWRCNPTGAAGGGARRGDIRRPATDGV
jgi:DNA-binding NarL/FixJ family response regulator